MPQTFVSSTTQGVGFPGYLTFTCFGSAGTGAQVSVSFNPTLCKVPSLQLASLQRVSIAVNGSIHVFQLSSNEPLTLGVEYMDLPWNDSTDNPEPTEGLATLFSFIRYTLNYYASICTMTTPDGLIEIVRYMGGIETFVEAQGRAQRAQRWNGNLQFMRVLT